MLEPIPIALLLAVVSAALWKANGRRGLPLLALAWVVYSVYEYLMYTRVLCSGECNIRIDLLLLYPLLLGGTVLTLVLYAWRAFKRRRGG